MVRNHRMCKRRLVCRRIREQFWCGSAGYCSMSVTPSTYLQTCGKPSLNVIDPLDSAMCGFVTVNQVVSFYCVPRLFGIYKELRLRIDKVGL